MTYPLPAWSTVPVPPPPPPVPDPDGVGWALVPLFTGGFGTPFSFFYASLLRRSPALGVVAAGYGALAGLTYTLLFTGAGGLAEALGGLLFMIMWIAGTTHAFTIRRKVYPARTSYERLNEHALTVAKHRRELRAAARGIAAQDPTLAIELRIGRPDLPRTYDDGWLIDVNHAPGPTLALLPGMTPELVERILKVREEQGGFISAEELALDANLPPGMVGTLAEYAIFLP